MFKNIKVNIMAAVCLTFAALGFILMVSGLKTVGSDILFFSLVLSLICGLTSYYYIGNNKFMGKSKGKETKDVLKNQSNGLKVSLPIILVVCLTIVLIAIYYLAF